MAQFQTVQPESAQQFSRLLDVRARVGRIAGAPGAIDTRDVSGAYDEAATIVQRRFDTLAAEVSAWASAGVEALAAAEQARHQPQAAAIRLADELDQAIEGLTKLLRI